MYKKISIMFVTVFLSSCAGLSQQYKASTQGIKINYEVNQEAITNIDHSVSVESIDRRKVKYVIGYGARPSAGNMLVGIIEFGALYAFLPHNAFLNTSLDPVSIFKVAITERLVTNGIKVSDKSKVDSIDIQLFVNNIILDFEFGTWVADVSYTAKVTHKNRSLCEVNVIERETAFNLFGFGSGEKALNLAFNNAINKFDIDNCLSKPRTHAS